MLAGRRVVQRRDLGAVVVGPPAVLVLEDRLSGQRPEVVLVERAERLDGQLDQCVQVARMVRADVHGMPFWPQALTLKDVNWLSGGSPYPAAS